MLIVVLIIVGIAGVYFTFSSSVDSAGTVNAGSLQEESISVEQDGGIGTSEEVKTFVLTGEHFKFMMNGLNNPEIKVKQGERIRIEFSSVQGLHDFVIDEFNVATSRVGDTDGQVFAEFIADKKGTFEYYCSVGEHRANGMKGNLIVE